MSEIRRSTEFICGFSIGLIFVALAAFAFGMLVGSQDPVGLWGSMAVICIVLSGIWLAGMFHDLRRTMDWR